MPKATTRATMPRACICICICICICNRVERKLVLVKWRQRFARTVGKGSRGLHKAGNEKIPRYQWEVDIEISQCDQMWMRGHQDTSENISTRSYQDIDEKKLGYQWRYRWDDIKVSRYWVAKRELCFDTVRNHQACQPCLGPIHEEELWTIDHCLIGRQKRQNI